MPHKRFHAHRWNDLRPGDPVYLLPSPLAPGALTLTVVSTADTSTPGAAGRVGTPQVDTVIAHYRMIEQIHPIDPVTGSIIGPSSKSRLETAYLLTQPEFVEYAAADHQQRILLAIKRMSLRYSNQQASEIGDFARDLLKLIDVDEKSVQ